MKTGIFYIYTAILNFLWIISLMLALAGGHAFTLRNPNNLTLIGFIIVCISNTLFLVFYKPTRNFLFKTLSVGFLFCVLFGCGFIVYQLLKLNVESYLINSPIYASIAFIFIYTINLLFKIINFWDRTKKLKDC